MLEQENRRGNSGENGMGSNMGSNTGIRVTKWDAKARMVQAWVNGKILKSVNNTLKPRNTPGKMVTEDGRIYYNDLRYGEEYPNSFLDLMLPDGDVPVRKPVLMYMHGGGFLFGSKESGDPLAGNGGGIGGIFERLLKKGIAVANVDYANAPDYRFPVQVHQVDQAAAWLVENAAEYGLDTGRILIMGSSAGADLTELYGLCVTDEAYADKIGVKPALNAGQVRGLIIDEAFLSLSKTEDENMCTMTGAWLGVNDIGGSEEAALADVPRNIGASYPPCYITASNKESFFVISAEDLKKVLEEKRLPFEYFYPEPEKYGEQSHGFATSNAESEAGKRCLEGMLSFMDRVRAD